MIETIYSNENGENNRPNKVQNTFKMPKNIRQVGKSSATKKIYVEDYVMTFIKQLAGDEFSNYKVAVLVGQYVKAENCRNIFISGVIEVEDIDTASEIIFSNDAWTNIYENIKNYFVDSEIVGWFVGGPGYLLEDETRIMKAHIDNFAGQDKTLLTYDNIEKEEAFLVYENNHLNKQEGYYIYYEKNEEMQNYMIDHKKTQSEEVTYDDRISREIRTVIQNKKPVEEDNKSVTRLMYAAGTLLAVIMLVVGAAMLSNYEQMKSMQTALDSLTNNLAEVETIFTKDNTIPTTAGISGGKEQSGKDIDASEGNLDVEVVPGEVNPLEKDKEDKVSEEELATQEEKTDNATPSKEEKKPEEEQKKETEKAKTKYYTVESGDTLAGICFKLYSSANNMKTIKELNKIEDENMIYAGQKLIVP